MQLAILTAVLAAIAAAEGGGGPVEGVSWRLWAIFAAALAPPIAALVAGHRLTHRTEGVGSRLQARFSTWLNLNRNRLLTLSHCADTAASHSASARLEAIIIGFWLAA